MDKKWSAMNRRQFLKKGIQGATGLSLAQGILGKKLFARTAIPNDAKPNVLLIITDQQHRETISAINTKYTDTPGMDSLYNRGTYFEQSYCTSPVCSPSRSSIFTSRMPSETGVYENGLPIREDFSNIAQWLSQKGDYEPVYAGKWHLPESATLNIPGFRVLAPGIGGRGMLADTSVSMSCEGYLRNYTGEKPFFMVASFIQPHDICQWIRVNKRLPHDFDFGILKEQAPELPKNFLFDTDEPEPVSAYRAKQHQVEEKWTPQHWQYYLWSYYRMVEQVDAEIENILLTLRKTGLEENTLIIFTSDHGEGLAEHQFTIKNVLYEAASRVPFIISLPGSIPEKKKIAEHHVSGLDIFPTICDYAGLQPPPGVLGRSLKPLLDGKKTEWRSFVAAESTNISDHLGRMIRTENYKYIIYANDGKDQLFDLKSDPGEMKNLASNPGFASVLDEHRSLLKNWENNLERARTLPQNKIWNM
jgi:arylsulfatase A-like enzyme